MKDLFVAAIAIVAAVAGLAVYLVKGTDYYCPQPSAASVATLFAPCQAFDTAMGHKVTKKEAVQMGLLKPDEQPSIAPDKPPAAPVAQLAARLAASVDPFLHQSGGYTREARISARMIFCVRSDMPNDCVGAERTSAESPLLPKRMRARPR